MVKHLKQIDLDTIPCRFLINQNYSSVLKERPGSLIWNSLQAVLGYTGQAMLGSKFQMRDTGLSSSTKEYTLCLQVVFRMEGMQRYGTG